MGTQFTTKVSGIPCICEVTHYIRAIPDTFGGRMEDAEQGSPSEFEFIILTSKGKPAKWLEKKLTDADIERLEEEFEVTLLEEKHCYDGDD